MISRPENPNYDAILADVLSGLGIAESVQGPDEQDKNESAALLSIQLDNDLKQARIDDVKSDRKLREAYATRILRFLYWYSIVVGIFVFLSGARLPYFDFVLPSEVLALLVGSTAVAAIGLVGFIARGLFKTPPALPPT